MKTKKTGNTWLVIKTVMFTSTLFVLTIAAFFLYELGTKAKDYKGKFETCQANFGEMEKSIDDGRMVINFRKE